ncbi:MAG: hypothetical protein ACFFA1_00560 [Promethearchaeota archaeon]
MEIQVTTGEEELVLLERDKRSATERKKEVSRETQKILGIFSSSEVAHGTLRKN